MLCYSHGVNLESGILLEDELLAQLAECGRQATTIAQAHHNDPGSNGHTFGSDRYHRATELAREPLESAGFNVARRGAGLIARRGNVELNFAVARGNDLRDPASFDAGSSPARRRAALQNTSQMTLDGMPASAEIVHIVWSGTVHQGLTAVHVGRLAMRSQDRLMWSVLRRVDVPTPNTTLGGRSEDVQITPHSSQPEPVLRLEAKREADIDQG